MEKYLLKSSILVNLQTAIILHFGHSTLVGQRPIKSLSSVCPSIHLPLSFFKIGSLVSSDIVHDDS